MHIYQGTQRRQVGGGIWSTIARGIRPLILGLINTLKPHAASAAKRVAKSAMKVGSEMAVDAALHGAINKTKLKDSLKSEASGLTKDAFASLKRKLDNVQTGSGNKRRKLNPKRKVKKMPKRKVQRRKPKRKVKRTVKRKQATNKRKVNKRSRSIRKKKTKSISRKVLRDIFNS